MRVLLDFRMAEWSGIGRYSRGLARALAARGDVELVLACAPGVDTDIQAEVISITEHPFAPRGSRALGRAVREVRPDVTHCLHFPTPAPVSTPLVVTLHDLSPLVVRGLMSSALKRAVYRAKNARAARVADAVITPSAHTLGDVERLLPSVTGKTRVIAEAADDFTSGPVGAPPDWLVGRRYVLSMGNTKPHKGLPTLFEAFEQLEEDELMLVLAGSHVANYIEAHVPHDVRARVRFSGSVDDATLRRLYADADAFAFPSLYEGFGLPPLEAMGMGAPVVCSAAASLPEVVGDAARLVPPGDSKALSAALAEVIGDADLRARMRDAGLARASRFSWSATAEATAALYREVVS